MQNRERMISILGWIATATAIVMYFSYIDQIRLNLSGEKGSIVQPAATVLNCTLWTTYGLIKEKKDWAISVANFPGVVLGLITLITAL